MRDVAFKFSDLYLHCCFSSTCLCLIEIVRYSKGVFPSVFGFILSNSCDCVLTTLCLEGGGEK